MAPPSTAERLRRILVLVPWVMARGGASVDEVCARFLMTPDELAADLNLLSFCGLPPFDPLGLIDARFAGGRVTIGMADYLARPPRLSRSEATALVVMGRALASLPGLEEAASLRSALDKLASAAIPGAGDTALELADRVTVDLGGPTLLADVREAATGRRRLKIEYYTHSRGAMTERVVDPLVVYGDEGQWYVWAFDHASNERRSFRIDRIKEATPTGDRFEPPDDADRDASRAPAPFTPRKGDASVVLDLFPAARWLVEAVSADETVDLGKGRTRLRLRTPHFDWLVRLLLAAGDGVTVVSPAELSERLVDEARRALERYA